ncbi:DUF962 domain-containing protein [Moraxella bovoculi]|uniref:Mpo1 family 2-hydroxy fatty acid dioxygenase n=1 Tax=Moraxella bovoculi TaxID=386891 RepID=UPI0006243BE3|nr:Mpo1-like protein [Moraxella bovoculi]ALT07574.1 hypothetical protein AAX08_08770 [Moraxella bovoculi]
MSLLVSNKSLQSWLDEYAVSHQDHTNKLIHVICVPVIFLTIVALIMNISPILMAVAAVGVLWFYLRLSLSLFLAMAVFIALCVGFVLLVNWRIGVWIAIFVVAWIGQFVGHKIEGAKPSFFEDLQFLLIGPAWVAMNLFKRA